MFFFAFCLVDECALDPNPCDLNALCTDTAYAFTCSCFEGYTGNGSVCEGMYTPPSLINPSATFFQISTSVSLLSVEPMPHAPTLLDHTLAFVLRGTLETG